MKSFFINRIIASVFYVFFNLFALSCATNSIQEKKSDTIENVDGTITIQGRVTVENTSLPPLGITTMNVKNKWKWKDEQRAIYGDNQKVYVNKKGYYKITIEKGDTLMLIPNPVYYGRNNSQYIYSGLTENQTIDIQIKKEDKQAYQSLFEQYPQIKINLDKHVKEADPENIIVVSGTIYSKKTKKPLKNVDVGAAFIENTDAIGSFNLTNKNGQFTYSLPKGNMFSILSLSPDAIRFYPQNDTVVNIYL